MVRVIKWHINIKADNTVTLSFITSINPMRQTFHPMSGQIVSLAVPNTLSSGTFTPAHPFIFPSRLIWQLAPKFFRFQQSGYSAAQSFHEKPPLLCRQCHTSPTSALDSTFKDQYPHVLAQNGYQNYCML